MTLLEATHPARNDHDALARRSAFYVVQEEPLEVANWPERALHTERLHMRFQCVGTGILVTLAGTLDRESVEMVSDMLSVTPAGGVTKVYLDMHEVMSVDVDAAERIQALADAGAADGEVAVCIVRTSEAMVRLQELLTGAH